MTKRRLLRWSLLLAILAAFAVWLEPTRVVWGWLRSEAFYQGRPTSWWRDELERMSVEMIVGKLNEEYWYTQEHQFNWSEFAANYDAATSVKFYREIRRFEQLWAGMWKEAFQTSAAVWQEVDNPPLLSGDLRARAVLRELSDDQSPRIRFLVRHGLRVRGAESTEGRQ